MQKNLLPINQLCPCIILANRVPFTTKILCKQNSSCRQISASDSYVLSKLNIRGLLYHLTHKSPLFSSQINEDIFSHLGWNWTHALMLTRRKSKYLHCMDNWILEACEYLIRYKYLVPLEEIIVIKWAIYECPLSIYYLLPWVSYYFSLETLRWK